MIGFKLYQSVNSVHSNKEEEWKYWKSFNFWCHYGVILGHFKIILFSLWSHLCWFEHSWLTDWRTTLGFTGILSDPKNLVWKITFRKIIFNGTFRDFLLRNDVKNRAKEWFIKKNCWKKPEKKLGSKSAWVPCGWLALCSFAVIDSAHIDVIMKKNHYC